MSAMLAIAGGSAILKHDARNKQNASYNRWAHEQKKQAARQLRIKEAGARQNIADIDRSKERDSDITADKLVALKLDALRVQESAKAAGLPEGKSTDAVVRSTVGEVLKQENAFLQDMDVKQQQYAFQEREIKFGMDMAFLDAQASIDSYQYRRGDGGMGLFMDMAGAYAKHG